MAVVVLSEITKGGTPAGTGGVEARGLNVEPRFSHTKQKGEIVLTRSIVRPDAAEVLLLRDWHVQ